MSHLFTNVEGQLGRADEFGAQIRARQPQLVKSRRGRLEMCVDSTFYELDQLCRALREGVRDDPIFAPASAEIIYLA